MAKEFIHQQTIVQWRIPVNDDGTLGNPEIVKKFTSEWNGAQGKHKKKIAAPKESVVGTVGEEYL